ncbi:MAG: DUF1232 domain-containing protein [Chloroflexi bacterium]|nr:DUF1232 domain-containing protein [Chloroflexota bacterium]
MTESNEDKSMNVDTALTTNRHDPKFLRETWQQARLVFYLLRDPEVPFYLKLLPFTAVLYLLWPIDLITDVLPFFGQLDDLTALLVGGKVFIELAPQHVVIKHLNAIREKDGYDPLSDVEVDIETAVDDVTENIVIDGEVIEEK